jgi:hypothetical protein
MRPAFLLGQMDLDMTQPIYQNSGPVPPLLLVLNGQSTGINDGELAFDASEMEGAVIENLDDMQALMSYSHTEVVIPSESSIKAAKEKRDRLRKTATTEEDFIPLTVSKREGPIGPHPESRLVREDDEMGEGDDGQWSLNLVAGD